MCGLHYASEVKSRQWIGRGEGTAAGLEWLLCGGLGFTCPGAMLSRSEDISPPVPAPATRCLLSSASPGGAHLTTGSLVFVFFFISRTDWEDQARIGTWAM